MKSKLISIMNSSCIFSHSVLFQEAFRRVYGLLAEYELPFVSSFSH